MYYINLLRVFLILFFGLILARSDLKKKIIPDKITIPLIITGIILNYIQFGISILLVKSYLILLLVYWFFTIFYKLLTLIKSSQTIGGGDVKYSLAIASLLPFTSFFIGDIYIIEVIGISFILMFAMVLFKAFALLFVNKLPLKQQILVNSIIIQQTIPFAPILYISSFISLLV